jgi:hypothetical protein
VLLPPFALEFYALSTLCIARSCIYSRLGFWTLGAFPISLLELTQGVSLLKFWRLFGGT